MAGLPQILVPKRSVVVGMAGEDSFEVMAAPGAYARRSLVNAFLSGRRRSSARDLRFEPEHEAVGGGVDLAQETADRDLVWRLLSTLPSRQRVALAPAVLRGPPRCRDRLSLGLPGRDGQKPGQSRTEVAA